MIGKGLELVGLTGDEWITEKEHTIGALPGPEDEEVAAVWEFSTDPEILGEKMHYREDE